MKTGPYIPLFSVGPALTKRLIQYLLVLLMTGASVSCTSETYRLNKAIQTLSGQLIKTNPALGEGSHEVTVLLKPKKPKNPNAGGKLVLVLGCICIRTEFPDGTHGPWECEPGCTPPAEPVPSSIRR